MFFLPPSLVEALFAIESPVSLAPIAFLKGIGEEEDESDPPADEIGLDDPSDAS